MTRFSFYEFFAGGGMVRAGLGSSWTCAFANDISPAKARAYRANFGGEELWVGDVHEVAAAQLPGRADLAWGSFPCQDLSLAGAKAGLSARRSGAFWGFMGAVRALRTEGRAPRLLALENVCGALTSRGGRDFSAICDALSEAGYRFGALVVDAALFVPQSRPRLFIVAVDRDVEIPATLLASHPQPRWSPRALLAAHEALDGPARDDALWWSLPAPRVNVPPLDAVIEREPADVAWRADAETERLVSLMAPLHRARLEAFAATGRRHVGAVYRRIRPDGQGGKVQRAEVRFDGLAGCLRTPAGGSSRQEIVEVEGGRIRSRLLSGREAARLMGLDDAYELPARYNEAYRLAGDGVAVPVVRFLAKELFEPLLGRAAAARLAG
ncbi:DNA cytosine methyltransferase [Chenggangzhangella methanolivorans]|uniref:DNA (cytosine-5-)-methyltransferase n=1 Tax=Chenggangzhangella methanolivorans TaxID=1437009 RepID=A0A9E6RD12_9HYPH|nr:DNA cytosine methyltransferase [Chenggangzhangella methanolivorans]QZN98790.1 DNA cytosine methyltransferase [Chenggangzhangella methanolivorans]